MELPEAQPIAAETTVTARSVNAGAVIDRSQGAPADDDDVQALAAAVGTWLDGHLDDLQRGGTGHLAQIAAPAMLDGADPALIEGVTTALASPADPVRRAVYDLEVGHDGAPRWLRARVTVTGAAGAASEATFVFVPGDDGPVLIALEPHGGDA